MRKHTAKPSKLEVNKLKLQLDDQLKFFDEIRILIRDAYELHDTNQKIKELLSYSKNLNKAKNGAYIGGLVAYEEKLTDLVFELDSDFATKTQDLYFNTKKWYCTWNENAGIQTGLFWINVKKEANSDGWGKIHISNGNRIRKAIDYRN